MNDKNHNPEISRLLRDLPREEAPPGFTRDVLRRLDEPRPERDAIGSPWTWTHGKLAAAAAALVLAVGSGVVVGLDLFGGSEPTEPPVAAAESTAPEAPRARLEALRTEHRRLAQEMEELRELIRDDEPFVYLGGDERVDFVYGLEAPRQRNGVEPAVHRNVY